MSGSLFPMGPVGAAPGGLAHSPGAANPPAQASGPGDFRQVLTAAAEAAGVDPHLVIAVATAESGLSANAVSPAGAMGLMQLMPGTARALGVQDPFNAYQNALGGATYLREMLQEFHGNVALALAAYNAGPGAVREYGGVPPYPETEAYVRGVLQSMGTALGGQQGI